MEGRERGAGVGRFKINGTTEERSRRKRKEETLRGGGRTHGGKAEEDGGGERRRTKSVPRCRVRRPLLICRALTRASYRLFCLHADTSVNSPYVVHISASFFICGTFFYLFSQKQLTVRLDTLRQTGSPLTQSHIYFC